jgi:amidophosphoribosyltransferase
MEIDGKQTLISFRDAHGFRPAVYGQRADGSWVTASESVSLDVLEARIVGHVPAGGIVFMAAGEDADVRTLRTGPHHHCVFEDIYFARPDSVLETGRVYTLRQRLGTKLAERWRAKGLEADVVVAVPDTSRPAAQSMSEVLGIPNREGFIKNRYSGRTFIMPDQATRETAMRLKLNPIEEIFAGQRVVIVDDSIVRGTTMRRILSMVRRLGPKALHVAIFSPPVRHPCFYGIDMPTREELVASGVGATLADVEVALAERLGADSVTFLPSLALTQVAGDRLCTACFSGEYPVAVADEEQGFIVRERRPMGVA